jgi:hypothetical protein
MRGHFRYLRFKTFPMTPRKPQCEVFWALLSNPKHSGVREDSKSPTLGVLGFTPTLGQSGVATQLIATRHKQHLTYKNVLLSIVVFTNGKTSQNHITKTIGANHYSIWKKWLNVYMFTTHAKIFGEAYPRNIDVMLWMMKIKNWLWSGGKDLQLSPQIKRMWKGKELFQRHLNNMQPIIDKNHKYNANHLPLFVIT